MTLREEVLKEAVKKLIFKAVVQLPEDVKHALKRAYESEDSELARIQLKAMLDNIKLAEREKKPICQDTGIMIFYVDVGTEFPLRDINLEEVLKDAVRESTDEIPLRPNAVDPLTRSNPGDNVGLSIPYISWNIVPGDDQMLITVVPKGAGSENMSVLAELPPVEGLGGVKSFILETVIRAGGKPCPPTIIGVGIGGTAPLAMKLADLASLRKVGSHNSDPFIADLERELLEKVNSLGIGTMGLGGKITALALHIESAYTHTASLPVAVRFQCWASRRASLRVTKDGVIDFI
ncbi:MAG: fumarate hydratase [Synergistetes bacterium]|nr:fumarate hydratase [Synergistota bacterium]